MSPPHTLVMFRYLYFAIIAGISIPELYITLGSVFLDLFCIALWSVMLHPELICKLLCDDLQIIDHPGLKMEVEVPID
jgi:hypothetical protein